MTLTIGLMADPGLPMELAQSLSSRPERKGGDTQWRFVAASEKLPLDENGEIPLIRYASGLRERHEWDYAIYITELPLWRRGRPILFEVIRNERSALISLPALGVLRLKHRLNLLLEGVARTMIEGGVAPEFTRALRNPVQHGSQEGRGDEYVLIGGRLGKVQLISGMVRSNRPGRLIRAMSNSVATAIATGTFGVFYASIWDLADALHPLRLTAIALLVIGALTAWLITHNSLWNTRPEVTDPGRRRRDNAATVVTIGISVGMMFLLLFCALLVSGLIIIDSDFLESQLGHPVGPVNYVRLSALAASLGMMAGAVGSNFDREEAIREATYSRREVERRKLADELSDEPK